MANDTNGNPFPEDCAESYSYNTDGTIATITRTIGGISWVNTYTYTSGKLSSTSGWVKQ
jgi:hypothetical protein